MLELVYVSCFPTVGFCHTYGDGYVQKPDRSALSIQQLAVSEVQYTDWLPSVHMTPTADIRLYKVHSTQYAGINYYLGIFVNRFIFTSVA